MSTSSSSSMLSVPSSPTSPTHPTRPPFNSRRTQDRLREGEGLYAMIFRTDSNLRRGRKSVFKEIGLDDDGDDDSDSVDASTSPSVQEFAPPFPASAQQVRPVESWYAWDALFACLGRR